MQRLKGAAEEAKIGRSSTMQTEINLPYLTADATGPKHLVLTMTRAKLEQLTGDLIEQSMKPVRDAMTDAGVKPNEIGQVVLVGGMTRMPKVQEEVQNFFGKEPRRDVNPDEAVAVGPAEPTQSYLDMEKIIGPWKINPKTMARKPVTRKSRVHRSVLAAM